MRALLATAGLLVLAGSAAAGPSTHTLRKSQGGPIVATAQDGGAVAWISSSTRACQAVRVLSPGLPDRALPQPLSGSATCTWDLSDGQSELAYAKSMSTALWTLHKSGPPFDYVLAASVGGPEREIARLAHASNGTGDWLGGVAGAGRTLAYSWDDVEYVDPLGCLAGNPCKEKIADGGIQLVTRTGKQPLAGAGPALGLAASAGRLAYVPATTVKAGRPSASTNSSLYVVDAGTGSVIAKAFVRGIPLAIALSPHLLAVLTTQAGPHDRITWFSATGGTRGGSVLVSPRAAYQLAASDQMIVYRVNRALYGVSTHPTSKRGARPRLLAKTAQDTVGLSIGKGQLVWAENHGNSGRLRSLALPQS